MNWLGWLAMAPALIIAVFVFVMMLVHDEEFIGCFVKFLVAFLITTSFIWGCARVVS